MEQRTVLKNDYLTVEISSAGAELRSILDKDNTERLWQRDEKKWNGQAPILFPACGCMIDGKYLCNGKTYDIRPHGFARDREFILESADKTKAVYLLKADSETIKVYPFDFELRVIYELSANKLSVTYVVSNKSDGAMYFAIGSHEGYICKGATTDYNLVFENTDTLENDLLDGPFLTGKKETKVLKDGVLSFTDEEFKALDTLVFLDIEQKRVTLKGKNTDKTITVEYPETPNLMVWKEPGAEFLCIEPWCGLPDYVGEIKELSEKKGINKLEKNGVFENTHTIIID